ncbi:cytochrome ubiquinol oxidase subunit I [Fodinicola feengrottensis]|uniref:cytochrome ubiquinol oxidase subunit I n=2 Tax=Fodinicola feengrottensis TaxID=435914 RepID=UPI0036F3CBFE
MLGKRGSAAAGETLVAMTLGLAACSSSGGRIVPEFQFGMSRRACRRFVGDIFGAPLTIEGLLAWAWVL